MTKKDKSRIFSGIVLILLGISLSGVNIFNGFGENSILLLIGGLFIAWYFYSNAYGLLIPGCILAGMGLASFDGHHFWNSPHNTQLGLGLGFIAIYIIDRVHTGRSHWWPLIPGGIITLSALSHGAFGIRIEMALFWPVVLILIGIWIIGKSTGLIHKKKENEEIRPLNKDENK
ncbi:MAG: hypothetical protein K9N09_12260 [Candidatus Cloacimonetes bacterium]|nr:hypothetical protein [Candidatus Cloacimonadota bacterium]MCF7813863.1 hypothetical protein [Candidatus Cloacimonadota bacterium]MCF7869457.1 hypothetical protein [Candidatus Cloacimonadota bacterium]MCF7883975.1 hypothetical protein [Candidatus Cloacimonadota bacterium]